MTRDPAELSQAFEEQVAAIDASSRAFDEGYHWEAKRLASAAYILVRDGGRQNKSILTQLGKKADMKFLASGRKHPKDPMERAAFLPLVSLKFNGGVPPVYSPRLEGSEKDNRWVSFNEWWERDIIFGLRDRKSPRRERNLLTRKKLIHSLRDQEGGAHYDKKLKDEDYAAMKKEAIWVSIVPGYEDAPLQDLELVVMRQVAWELLVSIKKAGNGSCA